MGGRCSSLQKWASSVFKIHPRIVVSEGKMTVGEKFKGKREAVLNGLLQTALVKKDKIDPHRIFITHSLALPEDVEFLKKGLTAELNIDEILETSAGCVIATHCGQKTIGILYIEKD
jgi:fatty acid-binding protein DegV